MTTKGQMKPISSQGEFNGVPSSFCHLPPPPFLLNSLPTPPAPPRPPRFSVFLTLSPSPDLHPCASPVPPSGAIPPSSVLPRFHFNSVPLFSSRTQPLPPSLSLLHSLHCSMLLPCPPPSLPLSRPPSLPTPTPPPSRLHSFVTSLTTSRASALRQPCRTPCSQRFPVDPLRAHKHLIYPDTKRR